MSALRRIRINKRLSVPQLAEQSGVSDDQIRNIESGRVRSPRVSTLIKLAHALDVENLADLDPVLTERAERTERDAA